MATKNLDEKIKDLLFGTIVFLILYLIVAYLLESSWLENPLGLPKTYEILKDGFSITATILAPVSALLLFSDWKEQHILKVIDDAARKMIEDLDELYILTLHSYYREPLEIQGHDIKLYEHPTKGSLYDLRRFIEIQENVLKKYLNNKHPSLMLNIMTLRELSLELENNIRIIKHSLNQIEHEKSQGKDESDLAVKQLTSMWLSHRRYYEENIRKLNKLKENIKNQLTEVLI